MITSITLNLPHERDSIKEFFEQIPASGTTTVSYRGNSMIWIPFKSTAYAATVTREIRPDEQLAFLFRVFECNKIKYTHTGPRTVLFVTYWDRKPLGRYVMHGTVGTDDPIIILRIDTILEGFTKYLPNRLMWKDILGTLFRWVPWLERRIYRD